MDIDRGAVEKFYRELNSSMINLNSAGFAKALSDIKNNQLRIMQKAKDDIGLIDEKMTMKIIKSCSPDIAQIMLKEVDFEKVEESARILLDMFEANKLITIFPLWIIDVHHIADMLVVQNVFRDQKNTKMVNLYEKIIVEARQFLKRDDHLHPEYVTIDNQRSYENPEKRLLSTLKTHSRVNDLESRLSEAKVTDPANPVMKLWEIYKILYGTGDRFSEEEHNYLRPLMEVVMIVANRGNLKLLYSNKEDRLRSDFRQRDSEGFFSQADSIIVALIDDNKKITSYEMGRIAHEMAHCVDYNLASGEGSFSDQNKDLKNIIDILRAKYQQDPQSINPVFSEIFSHYEQESYIPEVFVRGFELIASKGKDGIEIIEQQIPELLKFYDEILLPVCREFIKENQQYLMIPDGQQDYEEKSDSSSVYDLSFYNPDKQKFTDETSTLASLASAEYIDDYDDIDPIADDLKPLFEPPSPNPLPSDHKKTILSINDDKSK